MRIILIGSGKLIYFLARQFASKSYQMTIINSDADDAKLLASKVKATVLVGDGSDPARLEEAQAYRADALLALTPEDQDNLVACQIAQKRFSVAQTVALVNDPNNREVFEKLGVTVAFSATETIANSLKQQTEIEEIRNLVPVAEGQVSVSEVTLLDDSPVVGKTIVDLDPPDGTLVACIVRGDTVFVPKAWTQLEAGDRLVIIAQAEYYGALMRKITGEI
ncbi:MAG: NAD-binding protein [Cyanobacteriota bacterium]|nr:NAD-binding protein [Cyanobacteriota bacterium]